jgi:hypothetical protein
MAEVLPMPRADALPQPRLGRVALGFLVAPAVGTAAFLAIFMLYEVPEVLSTDPDVIPIPFPFDWAFLSAAAMVGYVVSGATTLIVGVPLYLVLRRRMRFTPGRAAAFGGGLAVVVVSYLAVIGAAPPFFYPEDPSTFALFAGPGLLAGLSFWLCAFWRDPAFSQAERP